MVLIFLLHFYVTRGREESDVLFVRTTTHVRHLGAHFFVMLISSHNLGGSVSALGTNNE